MPLKFIKIASIGGRIRSSTRFRRFIYILIVLLFSSFSTVNGVAYFDVKSNTFSYKLEKFDKARTETGLGNSATYTNLPTGDYTFIVRDSNTIRFKDIQETSLKVSILQAYHQTWWFKVLVALGVVFAILVFIQLRINSIKKQNKILEQKVIERTKDLDQKIEELNQEITTKDKFFSIIAHDLRSPFTALFGFSQHLVDNLDQLSKEDLRVISESILKSARLTLELLENLLNWARIQTGRVDYNPGNIDLNRIANETVELFRANAKKKDISIKINYTGEPFAYADLKMIETVFRNLISNAIKFTEKNGNISINVDEENDCIKVTVSDTGIGIDTERIDNLFKIGENESTLGTNKESGSGLGLILCKEFIEFNNGEILIESEKNKGTQISFTIPKEK